MTSRTPAGAGEDWAEQYTGKYEIRNPLASHLLDRFFATLGEMPAAQRPEDRVLEVGCGPGRSSLSLMKMLADLPGIRVCHASGGQQF
ncbi:MAG: hypothetical protein PVJ40_08270 [Gammaproteobacteria bacterium]|jgi:ubiquinone/menaquinone biosynthesis C-methylase UbiE